MFYDIIHRLPLQQLIKRGHQFNFKCNICNDGLKGKTRAWFFLRKGNWQFHCFNCSTSHTFNNFVKYYFNDIYKDIIKLSFKQKTNKYEISEKLQQKIKTYSDFPLISVDLLDENHQAKVYVKERKIPVKKWSLLYYSSDFVQFVNKVTDNRYPDWKFSSDRLVIPFYSRNGKNIHTFQGRALNESSMRYMTIRLDENHSKIFGMERINWSEDIIAIEGPLDSLFVDNAVAFGGSDLSIENIDKYLNRRQMIVCMDLETRNVEINKKVEKFLKNNIRVCLLPKELKKYGKDINEIIMNGVDIKDINNIIRNNVVQGKLGLLEHMIWKDC